MFSSQEYLDNKTGRDDLNRFQYLQALVTGFQDTRVTVYIFKGDVKSVLRTLSAHNNIPMTGTVRWNFN